MIRCSSIHAIMAEPKSKSEPWSETAKKAMLEIVRERIFNVRANLDDLHMIKKGNACEQAGIDLYNDVFLCNLKKVEESERKSNGIITGCPDLVATTDGKGVDIKIAWSALTFPITAEAAGKRAYEWQARGYMCLFDLPAWEIAYCLVDTPEEILRPWDDREAHIIDPSIPEHHRITVCRFERDLEIEQRMLERCRLANAWIESAVLEYAAERERYINNNQ